MRLLGITASAGGRQTIRSLEAKELDKVNLGRVNTGEFEELGKLHLGRRGDDGGWLCQEVYSDRLGAGS